MKLRPLILATLLILAGCSSASERANELGQRAVQLLELNDVNGSRMAALEAVQERDDSSDLWMLLARIEMARNDYIEAYRAFSRALELDRSNAVALGAVAEIGYQVGQLDEADSAADQLLLLLPDSDSALLIKGLVALDQDRKDDAKRYAERLLAANPASGTGLSLLARVLSTSGNTGEAKSKLNAALSTGKPDPTVLWTLVAILQNESDMAGTDAALTRLRSLAQKQYELAFKHVFLLYKSGQMERANDAIYELLEVAERAPDNERRIEQMWLDFGPIVLAPSLVERVRASPLQAAKLLLARHALVYGQTETTDLLLQSVDRSKLKAWQVNLVSGLETQTAYATNREADAKARAEALLERDPRNSDALLVLGKLAMKNGNIESASASFQAVIADNPMNRAGRIALAGLYASTDRKVLARKTWEQAIQDMPDDPELALAYVTYLRSAGDIDRQRRLALDHVAQNPGSPRALHVLQSVCATGSPPWCPSALASARARSSRYLLQDFEPTLAGNRGLFSSIKPKT